MAEKIKDLAVKVSEYVDATTGENRGRFRNVGAVLRGDDGGQFITLDRTFNPAGVPNPQNRDSVLIGMFDPKPRDGNQAPAPSNEPPPPTDDDLAF